MFSRFCKRPVAFSAVLCLSAFLVATFRLAAAQDARTVTYDTPVEGQITDAAPEESWAFMASTKDRIAILVERTGGTLLPKVELRDSNNQRITSADVDETFARARLERIELPSGGNYSIAVGRYQDANGKSSGNYRLTVILMGAGDENPSLKTPPQPVEYDKEVTGELTNARWKDLWTFNTTGRDIVTITARRTDGSIRPEIDLLDSAGNSVNRGYIDETGDTATLSRFRLPGPGQYTVVVQRENHRDGATAGKYSLKVALDGAGPEREDLLKPLGAVTVDGTASGTLTNTKWIDVYSLEAQSKDRLLLTVTRTEGNLIPIVYLFGANNQEINRGHNSDRGETAQVEVTLPGPGKYEVRVGRYNNESGQTTGKYELAVTILGLGEDNPAFKTSAGEIQIGETAKGTLTNVKWQDSWTINIQGTEPVTIVVRRTSGTLSPQLRLFGANQQEITSAYPDPTYAAATMDQIRLPGPGQYTIVVHRYNSARGETSGGYELSVTQGPKQ